MRSHCLPNLASTSNAKQNKGKADNAIPERMQNVVYIQITELKIELWQMLALLTTAFSNPLLTILPQEWHAAMPAATPMPI